MNKILSLIILLSSFISAAYADSSKSFNNINDKKGFWITPKSLSQNQLIVKNGEDHIFEGDICVLKWGLNNYNNNNNDNHNDNNNQNQKCLQVPNPGTKLVFKAYFPDSLHDVSDRLVITHSKDNKNWHYYLKTDKIVNSNLNQFSLTVGTGDKKTNDFLSIKAKLEKRILILKDFNVKYAGKHEYFENSKYIAKLISYLEGLIVKIDTALKYNPDILAQIRIPLQVDNKISAPFFYSSNFDGYILAVKLPVGSLFEGEKASIEASVTNLSDKIFYFPDFIDEQVTTDNNNFSASTDGQQTFNLAIDLDGKNLVKTNFLDIQLSENKTTSILTSKLNPNAANKIKVYFEAVNIVNSDHSDHNDHQNSSIKSLGALIYDLPVVEDTVAPVFSNLQPLADTYQKINPQFEATLTDSLGRIDPQSLSVVLNGITVDGIAINRDVTSLFSINTLDSSASYSFVGTIADLVEGDYQVTYTGKDYAGNPASSILKTIHFDKTVPTITLFAFDNILTNNPTFKISVAVFDVSPTETKIIQNGNEVYSSLNKSIDFDATLAEGINTFEIQSIDAAGNIADKKVLSNITLDTIPPVLANITPINNANIYTLNFNLGGISNEPLSNVKVNGIDYTLSGDKKSFSIPLKAFIEGDFPVDIIATDLAQNSTSIHLNYHIILKILNKDLIAITPNPNNADQLIISGTSGATRPGSQVSFYGGFFNRSSITSNTDGSFQVILDFFNSVDITANDLTLNRSDSATLQYNVDTTLAGIIRDTNDLPLAGATITIQASGQSTVTDQSGSFSIPKPATGDQILSIDGTTIPLQVAGPNRKFFKVNIAVSIGTRQSNVIDKPIHLAPLVFDGSETVIADANSSAVVASNHAPGVLLEIPAGVTTFPDSKQSGTINVTEISANYTSVPPFDFAKPNTVYAFEPSGVSFSQPVQLTLPNVNLIPPGVQMVIMSKNSVKGIWEIDGLARVSADGSEIVTEANGGITHFSEVYAAPIGPKVSEYGGTGHVGADVFNGSVQNSIDLPSYKVFGKDIAPNLSYHSNWANPYVVVSNVFDVPKNEYSFSYSAGQRSLFGNANVDIAGKSWIEPDSIDAQFYTNTITSPKLTFTGVPQKSLISFALDLSSLQTGLQTYNSHYDLHLKQMVVGTRTTNVKKLWGATRTYQDSFSETRKINEVFPQDLGGALYLQNYKNSKAGQGWRINGAGKIYNLTSPRMLVEDAGGATSSYTLNNTIETVYYNSAKSSSAVDLSTWPNITIFNDNDRMFFTYNTNNKISNNLGSVAHYSGKFEFKHTTYGYGSSYPCYTIAEDFFKSKQLNASLLLGNQLYYFTNEGNISTITNGETKKFSGGYRVTPSNVLITSLNIRYTCANTLGVDCTGWRYTDFHWTPVTQPGPDGTVDLAQAWNEGLSACVATPPVHSTGELPIQGFSDGSNPTYNSITSAIKGSGDEVFVSDFGNNRVRAINVVTNFARTIAGNGQTYDNGDGKSGVEASLYHPKGLAKDSAGNIYISTENGFIRKLDSNGYISTFAGATNGILADVTQAQQMRLSKPSGMVVDTQNNLLYVADTGHHRVVKIDLATRVATTVAGSGTCQSVNIGDGSSAITSSLCSPSNVGLDDQQNLLIFDQGHNRIRRVLLNNSTNGQLAYKSTNQDNSNLTRLADGTFLREFRNGSVATYDNLGRQTLSKDRIGNTFSFQYNSDGSLASITDPTNRVTNYIYSGSKLDHITDPQGRNTDFYYSGDQLTEVRFPDSSTRSFEYNSSGLMTAETDKRGSKSTYIYNEWNRLQSVTLADNSTSVIQDGTSGTIGNNFVSGNVGSLKSISKNEVIDGVKDSRGNTTTLNKDENGFVSKITDAKGNIYIIDRDIDGRPTRITRPDNSYSTFVYDSVFHDLTTKFDSATQVTINYEYDEAGNLLNQSLPNGGIAKYDYDANTGLLLTKTLPLNTFENYEYYANGLLSAKINALGQRSSYVYGSYGNVVTITDNANQSTQIIRDLVGNVISTTNAKGQKTENTYDNFNRLLSVKSPKGEITSYEYLPSGELEKIIDPENNKTFFEYNFLGRLIRKTDPLGLKTELAYDFNGNVIQEIDPSGNVKTFEYDNLDRLVKKTLPDNIYTFTYDPRNNLESIANNSTQISYVYTQREGGDLVAQVTTNDGVIAYDYDVSGNKIETATAIGSFFYSYDALNRLTKIVNHKGERFDNSYDNGSRLVQQRSPASITSYAYDSVNFLTQIAHQKRSNLATIAQLDYTRDAIGNITKMTSIKGDFAFVYDNNNQLINATHPEDITSSFTYDALGNRITDQFGNFNYDSKRQRLNEDWKYIYAYDNNGNLSSKILKSDNNIVTNFIHNSENQLINIKEYSGTSVINETRYFYDATGRRIRKEHIDYVANTNSFVRKFQYDGQEILFEQDQNNNLLSTFTHSGLRTDDVLSVDKAGTSYFYLKDHLGSVNDLVDSSGNLVQHYVYSPFGKITRIENSAGADITQTPMVENFYTFTGREFDKESGLYYYRARYYDPEIGRFLQTDPDAGSLKNPITNINKYTYVANNPINLVDPSGRRGLNLGFVKITMSTEHFVQTLAVTAIVTIAILCPAAIPAMLKGAAIGAGLSGGIAYATGGDVGKAIMNGAIIGALAGGVGFTANSGLQGLGVSSYWASAGAGLAQGTVGGIYAVEGAGDRSGFLQAFALGYVSGSYGMPGLEKSLNEFAAGSGSGDAFVPK